MHSKLEILFLLKENKILQLENHTNYNCEISTDSGEKYRIYANWLHNEHLDAWKGWHCHAGTTRLYIDKELTVFGGECKNDHLGHALTGFNILDGTICQQDRCGGCTDDLMVSKHAR